MVKQIIDDGAAFLFQLKAFYSEKLRKLNYFHAQSEEGDEI